MTLKTLIDLETLEKLPKAATRIGYGEGVLQLAQKDPKIVVLSADLTESMRVLEFQKKYPERFFQVGVAEQNMMGMAAGLALSGKVPFVSSYAAFSPGRNWDQLRVSVCYSQANVKVVGGHTGLMVGPDGATHQALEDIAITRCLPNMTVVYPCDAIEARKATIALGKMEGPAYLRLVRESTPTMTTEETPFVIGKANVCVEGSDVTIVGAGPLLFEAVLAAKFLKKDGIDAEVINSHTIKPLDEKTLLTSFEKTGCGVTVEDHQVQGGLGSAISELLSQHFPAPLEFIGMKNSFGESGAAKELLEKYQMTAPFIIKAVKKVLARKHTR